MQTLAPVTWTSLATTEQRDEPPEAEDVTAGTWGLVVFVLLVLATVVLMRSFLKHMRKTEQARRAGVFGEVSDPESSDDPDRGAGGA